jgi:23S rRNA pseudouridine2605 synthase
VSKRAHLKRALSKLGWCSRGVAEEWIARGLVRVNGVAAVSGEQWVEIGMDRIEAEGRVSAPEDPARGIDAPAGMTGGPGEAREVSAAGAGASPGGRIYLALHKPPGFVTTRSDELGRKTVYDLLPAELRDRWLFPVGRLDKDSEGLLLMTDDGEWSDRLTDPESHVDKVYRVKLDGRPLPAEMETFRAGMTLDGGRTLPAGLEEDGSWYRVTLREGRNRQIRRMFHALGYKVKRLVRISIGPLELGGLESGKSRRLAREEVAALSRPSP